MKSSSTTLKVVSILASLIIFVGLTCLADRLVLPRFADRTSAQGLLFPPGSEFPYQTPEFSHRARINSLGFRDREWNREKNSSTTRILAIGDSFTFGMGAELDQTWPKILEQRLRAQGFDLEIANLGRPGASPSEYAEVAEKAIPLLKPDIILVAILQGDDLAQTIRQVRQNREQQKTSPFSRIAGGLDWTARFLYPHTSRLIGHHLAGGSTFRSRDRLLEKIWQSQAEKLAAGYRGEGKARFDAMGSTARDMFLKGHLNPGIVSMAISDPHYFATPLQTEEPLVRDGLRKLQDHLQNIKKFAGGAPVIVVSMPLGAYVSEDVWKGRKEIGFTTHPEMLHTTIPDEELKKICAAVGIPFLSVTERFRRQSVNKPLYYKYDGHFNPRGHQVFVEELLPLLQKHVFNPHFSSRHVGTAKP
ncbi:MAG: GDSL-type esterase/lipase family protein [Desulfobulbaceae bacterium]|nr:GDSL-type esterase/lipase family protein [Desulfobulbaceae bacterium]